MKVCGVEQLEGESVLEERGEGKGREGVGRVPGSAKIELRI